jgi:hypothetical protein
MTIFRHLSCSLESMCVVLHNIVYKARMSAATCRGPLHVALLNLFQSFAAQIPHYALRCLNLFWSFAALGPRDA